jgi:hypothetical protein
MAGKRSTSSSITCPRTRPRPCRHGRLSIPASSFTTCRRTAPGAIKLSFSKLERDCIARGNFSSTLDLKRKLLACIERHNKEAIPSLWTYNDPKRHIRVTHQTIHSIRPTSSLPYCRVSPALSSSEPRPLRSRLGGVTAVLRLLLDKDGDSTRRGG